MHIGILLCGHTTGPVAEHHGDFDRMFATLLAGQGLTFSSYDVENLAFPDSAQACDGWLLTGSKHGAYEDHPFIAPLTDFIRAAYAAEVPMVGICFGHQIIAQALGGRVEKFAGGWGVGHQTYDFDGLGAVALNAWHQDQVTQAPPDARPIGRSDFCANAGLIYGKRALTVQPHPEFPAAVIDDMVQTRRGTADYPDDRMDLAAANLDTPTDRAAFATMIARFFKGLDPNV